MRRIAWAVLAVGALACGDKADEPAPVAAPAAPIAQQPAALAVAVPPVEVAELDWSACGDYGARVGSWVRELDAAMVSGRPVGHLAAFTTELAARLGGVKDAPAGHDVLAAAVQDFSEGLAALADAAASGDESAARTATKRLENGADNIELAAKQVITACE